VGRFVFTLAVGVWIGTLVSFSYVILPGIHRWGREGQARDLLRHLFPRYHLTGIVCGLIALAVIAMAPRNAAFGAGERVLLGAPVAVALLCAMIGRQVLLPRLAALDSGDQPGAFERAHQIAAMLNTTSLAMLLLALAAVTTS
jgi:hypothetical protein